MAPDERGVSLTRRQLLAAGIGVVASVATGGVLTQSLRQLAREDLVPGVAPTLRLPARAWTTRSEHLSFAALGDNGSGGRQAMAVAERMARSYAEEPFGLVSLLGDICYYGPISRRFPDVFSRPMGPLLAAGVEFELAIGNHDGGLFSGDERVGEVERTLALLGTPSRYYSVTRGPVDFFYLDSVGLLRREGSAQLAWLDDTLASATSPWRIVCTHHPLYSSGRHGPTPALTRLLEPILVRHRVDLVLAGHDHHYERTVPIGGVTHLVSGGGCKLTPVAPQRHTAFAVSALQFLRIDVTPEQLTVRSIAPSGVVLDRFRLRPTKMR